MCSLKGKWIYSKYSFLAGQYLLLMVFFSAYYSHWYISGYALSFENLANGAHESLFHDVDKMALMFCVVIKSNLTKALMVDLVHHINNILLVLDKHGFKSIKSMQLHNAAKKAIALQHKVC
jgi:hypothetical protein